MSEKDKNCIEFSMRSMMVTQRPYQEDAEIEVTGMIPGREILATNNPFDTPCVVVMVPKREFERLQTENEELKKASYVLDPLPEFRELLKKIYSTNDVEKLEWTLNHICGGRGSVNGWIAVSLFWKQNCETLSKLVGFSSVEEIQDYLTNEAKTDTLYEAIHLMCKEMDHRQKKIDELRDDISGRSTVIESYKRGIEKWQKVTGCPTPEGAKSVIESGMSWNRAYNEIKEANRKLGEEVKSWQNVTGHATPEDYIAAKIHTVYVKLEPSNATWRDATGCNTPEEAKSRIEGLENAVRLTDKTLLGELEREIDAWQKATGRIDPEAAKQYINRLEGRLRKIHDYSVEW